MRWDREASINLRCSFALRARLTSRRGQRKSRRTKCVKLGFSECLRGHSSLSCSRNGNLQPTCGNYVSKHWGKLRLIATDEVWSFSPDLTRYHGRCHLRFPCKRSSLQASCTYSTFTDTKIASRPKIELEFNIRIISSCAFWSTSFWFSSIKKHEALTLVHYQIPFTQLKYRWNPQITVLSSDWPKIEFYGFYDSRCSFFSYS